MRLPPSARAPAAISRTPHRHRSQEGSSSSARNSHCRRRAAAAWIGSLLQDMVPVGQLSSTAREVAKSGAQGQRLSDIFAAHVLVLASVCRPLA